jgi:hypothetical protein
MATRLRSPRYPSMSLEDAIEHGRTIFDKDRRHPIAREVAASHIGYKSLNGAADSALSSLMQYGILEKVAKGEVRVSQWAVDILHPDNPAQRIAAIQSAARNPALFQALDDRFRDAIPSNETLRSYLTRENFNDRAIGPVIAAYTKTRAFVTQEGANDFPVPRVDQDANQGTGDDGGEKTSNFGGARVGDLVQREIDGVLQMETPMRVRLVSEDGLWIAVEGSENGLPMEQVIVRERAPTTPIQAPKFAIEAPKPKMDETPASGDGFRSERFDADEGVITISWPSNLSPQSVEDMQAWVELLMKRIERRAKAN